MLQVDDRRNLLGVRYLGRIKAADMEACLAEALRLLPRLRRGFTIQTDLSGLEAMELDCVPALTKFMDRCKAAGVAKAIRIIPNPEKDIGLNILSLTHYRGGVKVITCRTAGEADSAAGD